VVNINDYFSKHNVNVLTTKLAFDFIVEFEMVEKEMDSELKRFFSNME